MTTPSLSQIKHGAIKGRRYLMGNESKSATCKLATQGSWTLSPSPRALYHNRARGGGTATGLTSSRQRGGRR